jgi:hypothetical protein
MLRICALALRCLPIALMVTGCGIIPGYRERLDAALAAQQAAIDNADDAQCRQYGARPGSDGYVACRMNLANNRQAADAARQQAWADVTQSGLAMAARPPAPQPAPPADHVCIAPNNTYYRC